MLEKPCVCPRSHIFFPIIMKFDPPLSFDEVMKLVQNFCLMKSRMITKMGRVGSKNRSLGHILEKHCIPSRDQIFGLILKKLGHSVRLDKILQGVRSHSNVRELCRL